MARRRRYFSLKASVLRRVRDEKVMSLHALLDLVHGQGIGAFGTEQVDLEDERILGHALFQDVAQRRVGDEAAVPVGFAVDHHRRKAGRQGAGRHDVFRTDDAVLFERVEIDEITVADIDGAETEAHRAAIDAVEIDMVEQGLAQRRGVVEAGRLGRARRIEPRGQEPRPEKARHADGQAHQPAELAVAEFGRPPGRASGFRRGSRCRGWPRKRARRRHGLRARCRRSGRH